LDLDFERVEFSFGAQIQEATTTKHGTRDALEGRRVLAHGHLKGYRGIIKTTNRIRGMAQVELEAGQRLHSLELSALLHSK
jgi:transcription elongation factor